MRSVLILAATAFCLSVAGAEPLALDRTISLEHVTGRIDHMAVDVAGQRLFVAALGNNTVEVADLKAGKAIASLSGFAEPQGIAYVPELDRLFVANGDDGTCRILDGHSFKTISSIKLGEDADNVRYDEKAKRIYVGYGSGALGVIDAEKGDKVADIPLAGHPESFRLSSIDAKIFVNVPHADHIAVIDRQKAAVIAKWPLKDALSNFPMILDETNRRLFVGCRSPAVVLVYDSANGKQLASVPISHDTDDLFYNSEKKLLYVSCGGGAIDIIQAGTDRYTKVKSVETPSGSRTSLYVPELHIFCLAVPRRGNRLAEIRVFKTN